MNSTPLPPDAPPPRRSPWKLSLRELLLVMTALSAAMALLFSARPLEPTAFFRSFQPYEEMLAAGHESGVQLYSTTVSGEPVAGLRSADHTAHLSAMVPEGDFLGVYHAFQDRLEQRLRAEGCRIERRERSSAHSFEYHYRRGPTRGHLTVHGYWAKGHLNLVCSLVEHR